MAGQLTIDTLRAGSGVLATQNGMTGIAKAWVNYNGLTASRTIRSSFNVSSVTYNSTGDYTVNFTTAMPDANYCTLASQGGGTTIDVIKVNNAVTAQTTSLVRVLSLSNTFAISDSNYVYVAILGN